MLGLAPLTGVPLPFISYGSTQPHGAAGRDGPAAQRRRRAATAQLRAVPTSQGLGECRQVVIAAGGTAGHVVPALAVADALRAEGARRRLRRRRARRAEAVPEAGYELRQIRVEGLSRAQPAEGRAGAGARRRGHARRRAQMLREVGADVVMGGGGYVAGPVGAAARARADPARADRGRQHLGLTNRLLAPFARRVCLAFPIAGRDGGQYRVTGRPVPPPATDRAAARARFGVGQGDRCVLVFGGSLGARSINEAAVDGVRRRRPFRVLHARRDARLRLAARSRRAAALRPARLHLAASARRCRRRPRRRPRRRLGVRDRRARAAGDPRALSARGRRPPDRQRAWMVDAGAAVVVRRRRADGRCACATRSARCSATPARLAARWRDGVGARLAPARARPRARRRARCSPAAEARSGERARPGPGAGALRRHRRGGHERAGRAWRCSSARRSRGSDRAESPALERAAGARRAMRVGHDAANVPDGRRRLRLDRHPGRQPGARVARALPRAELLRELTALKRVIAIAGAHGKTTTTSMVAHALLGAGGRSRATSIGGALRDDGRERGWGDGGVARRRGRRVGSSSMLALDVEWRSSLNIELDHHATYGSLAELNEAFDAFRRGRSRRVVVAPELARDGDTAFDARGARPRAGRLALHLAGPRGRLQVPGAHNARNAAAALEAIRAGGRGGPGRGRRRAGDLRGRGPAVRAAGETAAARSSSTTTPTTRPRSRRRSRPRGRWSRGG